MHFHVLIIVQLFYLITHMFNLLQTGCICCFFTMKLAAEIVLSQVTSSFVYESVQSLFS